MKGRRLLFFSTIQRAIAGAVLCSFAIFASSLPLEHTCLLHVGSHVCPARAVKSNPAHLTKNSSPDVASIEASSEVGTAPSDGVCLACAWSQSLVQQASTVHLIVPGPIRVPLVAPSLRVAPFLKYSQAIPKRGPPSALLAS